MVEKIINGASSDVVPFTALDTTVEGFNDR
jgi:hypothetical protein